MGLVRDTAGYRLVPIAEAVGAGNVDAVAGRVEPGYGLSVVPLRYVSAQALMPLLDSFATRAGSVRADPGRNLLLIQGSGPERRAPSIPCSSSMPTGCAASRSVSIRSATVRLSH